MVDGENIKSMADKIAAKLQADLLDPISARQSDWVYSDSKRISLDKTGFPKILLLLKDQPSNKVQLALGNPSTENRDEVKIQIKTEVGKKYTYKTVDYTGPEFAAILGQEVENLIKLNHAYWITQGFLDVICIKDELIEDKDSNPIFNVEIEMHYISDPNN